MRDTASKASPTSLLFSGREKSTITSTMSTMMSITPNILKEKTNGTSSLSSSNNQKKITNHHASLPKFAPKHTHRKPKDITKGAIFSRILLQKRIRVTVQLNLQLFISSCIEKRQRFKLYQLTDTLCLVPQSHPFHHQSPL